MDALSSPTRLVPPQPSPTSRVVTAGFGRTIGKAIEIAGMQMLERAKARRMGADAARRPILGTIVGTFQEGFRHACRALDTTDLVDRLSTIDRHLQGFAYEGAAMACSLRDLLTLRSPRSWFTELLAAAPGQTYLLHVGRGWALARAGRPQGPAFQRMDRLLRWLALDGVGFHDGYMNGVGAVHTARRRRRRLTAYGARVFDQGLGRSLWFTAEVDPSRISAAISAAEAERRPDLWSGVGLACAYAGGATEQEILEVKLRSGPLRAHLAQGAAFAAEAYVRAAGSAPAHTERACTLICGSSAGDAAAVARDALGDAVAEGDTPAYERWRRSIRSRFE